jgi:hypothetical protein
MPPQLPYPDNDREDRQISLRTFCLQANELSNTAAVTGDWGPYVKFVVSGLSGGNQVFINTYEDAENPVDMTLGEFRDYDSVFSITTNLPFKTAMSVYPIPPFKDTLTSDIHMSGTIYDEDVGISWNFTLQSNDTSTQNAEKRIGLHNIPNMCLGKIKPRQVTHIFFPRLYCRDARDSTISTANLTTIYNHCLRPAILSVCPQAESQWPISYAHGQLKAQGKNGFHWGSVDIGAPAINAFADALRRRLDNYPKFRDSYFFHDIMGTKMESHHDPERMDQRSRSLSSLLDYVNWDQTDRAEWTVDVAYNLWAPDRVLQWKASAHHSKASKRP